MLENPWLYGIMKKKKSPQILHIIRKYLIADGRIISIVLQKRAHQTAQSLEIERVHVKTLHIANSRGRSRIRRMLLLLLLLIIIED